MRWEVAALSQSSLERSEAGDHFGPGCPPPASKRLARRGGSGVAVGQTLSSEHSLGGRGQKDSGSLHSSPRCVKRDFNVIVSCHVCLLTALLSVLQESVLLWESRNIAHRGAVATGVAGTASLLPSAVSSPRTKQQTRARPGRILPSHLEYED